MKLNNTQFYLGFTNGHHRVSLINRIFAGHVSFLSVSTDALCYYQDKKKVYAVVRGRFSTINIISFFAYFMSCFLPKVQWEHPGPTQVQLLLPWRISSQCQPRVLLNPIFYNVPSHIYNQDC